LNLVSLVNPVNSDFDLICVYPRLSAAKKARQKDEGRRTHFSVFLGVLGGLGGSISVLRFLSALAPWGFVPVVIVVRVLCG
jgi:hypothetical protein